MKKLVLKKLIIISHKTQEAKIINFDEKLTVLTGDNPKGTTINRTGKSLVMKSIYYSLGAELKKYTSNWNNMKISTLMIFNYEKNSYELYRNKDRFVLKINDTITKFNSISDLRQYYVEFFNFKIKLPIKNNDKNAVYAYPGAIFMPFYIDQDKGWSGSWDSFNDIFSGKWKNEILLYHMGIRTPKYYDLLDEKVDLELKQKENKSKENTVEAIIENHITKYSDFLDINIDLNMFEEEIANLTEEISIQLEKRNLIKEEIVDSFNKIKEFDELYEVAQKVYNEMLLDTDYVENNIQDETIICPICGTPHENNIQNRFNMYTEIEECEETINSYFEERSKLEKRIHKKTNELKQLEDYIDKINSILDKKRDTITFRDVIVAEGSKSILEDMKIDLSNIQNSIMATGKRLKEITKEQTKITKEGKHINDLYLENLKSNLELLDVSDIDDRDLKKFKASFNSGGNDLPCAILAQIYTLYYIASKYSHTILLPIVLDAIFQQEPAKDKINNIWEFIISNQPEDSQLIISTTEMHGHKVNGKIITLLNERGLLNQEDYKKEFHTINWYKNLLLNKDKDN